MSHKDLMAAIDLIKRHQNLADFEGPKSPDLIAKAEMALGCKLSKTYVDFLVLLGCGDIGGHEIYGVISEDFENSGVPDAIWFTREERKNGLPENLVVIYVTGDGIFYAIDTSVVDEFGENPIVAWTPGISARGDQLPKIANSFGEFLFQTVKQAVDI